MKKRGAFICIEGLDASGKTTQSRLLVKKLRRKGFKCIYTSEPSQSEIGEFIRAHILKRKKRVPIVIEALLFALDRFDHVERRIKPALQSGRVVISDRYLFSSMAYQGAAGLDLNWIKEINKLALPSEITIYIDILPDVGIERINRERSVMERLKIQQNVRKIYMKMIKRGLLLSVDDSRPVHEVSKDILDIVLDHLKRRL